MKVIKVGGSLARDAGLAACLEHINAQYKTDIIVVPGGGAFADQVRLAQQTWGVDEVIAHQMAILAMQQMALLFHGLQPRWKLLKKLTLLQQQQATVGIWFPELALLNQAAIPASWDISSDSLAAWLAGQLGATELIVVKAAPVKRDTPLSILQQQGMLDAAFLQYTAPLKHKITVINQQDFISSDIDNGLGYAAHDR